MSTNESSIKTTERHIMDKRFEELLAPEAVANRALVIEQGPYNGVSYNYGYNRAKQTQHVIDARDKLEELAEKLRAHKENGETILEWLKEADLPGVDCWVFSISELEDNDIVGDALSWAASNHNC